MEHSFVFNALSAICYGTWTELTEHSFVFKHLAFARREALMGYWYQMV